MVDAKKILNETLELLKEKNLTDDTIVFSQGKKYEWTGETWAVTDDSVKKYSEYDNDYILSIITEGILFEAINYYGDDYGLLKLLEKHGCYYEKGYQWSLSVCEI